MSILKDIEQNEVKIIEQNEDKICGKHFKHMTKTERLYLLVLKDNKLRKSEVKFAKHALDRMNERYIKERDVIRALKNGQILEYRKTDIDEVIAIRGCSMTRRKEQVYVIYSITKNKVITTYSNKHWEILKKSQNLDKYDSNFNIEIPRYYREKIRYLYGVS